MALADEAPPDDDCVPLLSPVVFDELPTLTEGNAWFESQWAGMPVEVKDLSAPARYPVVPSEGLLKLTEEVDGHIV